MLYLCPDRTYKYNIVRERDVIMGYPTELSLFGEYIKLIMRKRGMTQSELSRAVGVEAVVMHKFLASDLKLSTMLKVCDALDIGVLLADGFDIASLNDTQSSRPIMEFLSIRQDEQIKEYKERKRIESKRLARERTYRWFRESPKAGATLKRTRQRMAVRDHGGKNLCEDCKYGVKKLNKYKDFIYCKKNQEYGMHWRCKEYKKKGEK